MVDSGALSGGLGWMKWCVGGTVLTSVWVFGYFRKVDLSTIKGRPTNHLSPSIGWVTL